MAEQSEYQNWSDQQLVENLIKASITVGEFSYNPNISDSLRKAKKKALNELKAELLRRLNLSK